MPIASPRVSEKIRAHLIVGRDRMQQVWLSIRVPLFVFAATRVGLFLIAYVGLSQLPLRESQGLWRAFPHNLLLDGWLRWDSGWYLSIVRRGYFFDPPPAESSVAFFPLYPLAIKALSLILGSAALSSIVVSNLALLAALLFLYRLVCRSQGEAVARRAVLLLCVFPYSFFFSAAYSESLFLLLAVGTFYFGEQRRWLVAASCAAMASATRLVGLSLTLALAVLYLESISYDTRRVDRNLGWLLLAPLGLVGFAAYLYVSFGDPFVFVQATSGWDFVTYWAMMEQPELRQGLLGVALWVGHFRLASWAGLLSAIAFVLIVLAGIRSLRPAYTAYGLLVLAIPIVNANVESMARYAIVAFPAFIVAAIALRSELASQMVVVLSSLLLAVCTVLFANWYWLG